MGSQNETLNSETPYPIARNEGSHLTRGFFSFLLFPFILLNLIEKLIFRTP